MNVVNQCLVRLNIRTWSFFKIVAERDEHLIKMDNLVKYNIQMFFDRICYNAAL